MDNQRSGSLNKHDSGILGLARLVENKHKHRPHTGSRGSADKVSEDEVLRFECFRPTLMPHYEQMGQHKLDNISGYVSISFFL